MILKIIESYRTIVAVCDSELIGKKFEDEKFQLNVKENFFLGEEMDEKKVINLMERMSMNDATFNMIGKKSVAAALKAGIILEEGIKEIQGVPFALVLL